MQLESKKLLEDARQAASRMEQFIAGNTFEDYAGSDLRRAGVERQFEIVGEARNRLSRRVNHTSNRSPLNTPAVTHNTAGHTKPEQRKPNARTLNRRSTQYSLDHDRPAAWGLPEHRRSSLPSDPQYGSHCRSRNAIFSLLFHLPFLHSCSPGFADRTVSRDEWDGRFSGRS